MTLSRELEEYAKLYEAFHSTRQNQDTKLSLKIKCLSRQDLKKNYAEILPYKTR